MLNYVEYVACQRQSEKIETSNPKTRFGIQRNAIDGAFNSAGCYSSWAGKNPAGLASVGHSTAGINCKQNVSFCVSKFFRDFPGVKGPRRSRNVIAEMDLAIIWAAGATSWEHCATISSFSKGIHQRSNGTSTSPSKMIFRHDLNTRRWDGWAFDDTNSCQQLKERCHVATSDKLFLPIHELLLRQFLAVSDHNPGRAGLSAGLWPSSLSFWGALSPGAWSTFKHHIERYKAIVGTMGPHGSLYIDPRSICEPTDQVQSLRIALGGLPLACNQAWQLPKCQGWIKSRVLV